NRRLMYAERIPQSSGTRLAFFFWKFFLRGARWRQAYSVGWPNHVVGHGDLRRASTIADGDQLSFFGRFLLRRCWRACFCWRGLLALLGQLRNRQNLDLLVGRRSRMRGIEQLLLAEPDRLDAFRRDLERVDQDVADGVGPALAQDHVAFALAVRLDVAD